MSEYIELKKEDVPEGMKCKGRYLTKRKSFYFFDGEITCLVMEVSRGATIPSKICGYIEGKRTYLKKIAHLSGESELDHLSEYSTKGIDLFPEENIQPILIGTVCSTPIENICTRCVQLYICKADPTPNCCIRHESNPERSECKFFSEKKNVSK